VREIIKRWRKLSENKKMVHNIPQVRQMITMLEEQENRISELEEEKLNMQISLIDVSESIGRISAFIENIEPRSHEAVITFNQCMEICTAIDEMDLPEFELKGGAE
jgi:wobble nucleotide-excising tRNase